MNKGLEKIKKNIIMYIACICAIFLHFYVLDKIPMAWHPDEAGSAYDAWCIANYGVDRYRMSYPVLLRTLAVEVIVHFIHIWLLFLLKYLECHCMFSEFLQR